ncbi:hypothetical protein BD310DRAFT_969713 [Dichomitus squalens]|uniref:Uncharacterized protein n=1 Tax=Dichomitus squalens TaxID=114155 RepID=A0A4Q9PKG1_9APHY|nr:hypothetical protein BD310DRAFT_969713 [Dichomitus squalens]
MFPLVSQTPAHFSNSTAEICTASHGAQTYIAAFWPSVILLVLSTALMGLYTALVSFALTILIRRGSVHVQVMALLAVMLVMYASAAFHWGILLLSTTGYYELVQAYVSEALSVCGSASALSTTPMSYPSEPGFTYGLPGVVHGLTLCAPTGILTLNVLLGDAIVWWRAWIIWPRSLIVRGTCVVLLAVTTGAYTIDLTTQCILRTHIGESRLHPDWFLLQAGRLWCGCIGLIPIEQSRCHGHDWMQSMTHRYYREHRKMFEATTLERSSRIERLLVLLVESGTVYCLLWGFILAYQTSSFTDPALESRLEQQVLTGFDYFMKGCLIPLIGIYPTTIIVLVALNRSHFHGTVSTDKLVSDVVFRHQPDITNDEAASSLHTAAEVSSCGGRDGQLGADEDFSKGFIIADKDSDSLPSYLRGPDRARPLTTYTFP